jgi:hypothetical protein
MGAFSAKFLGAAQVAGQLLAGTLYERYYGLDYAAVLRLELDPPQPGRVRTSTAFAALCRARAGPPEGRRSVVDNGMVIEQAQILTTHNLAALLGPVGLRGAVEHRSVALAGRAFDGVVVLLGAIKDNAKPLRVVKDAAYAWRQMMCFLALAPIGEQAEFVADAQRRAAAAGEDVRRRLTPLVLGLVHVVAGGAFDGSAPAGARRFVGWSADGHWMLPSSLGRRA